MIEFYNIYDKPIPIDGIIFHSDTTHEHTTIYRWKDKVTVEFFVKF